jgi:hypothetical protein
MARPRKPTADLELRGAFRKNPQRRRKDPETAGPLGEPPPGWSEDLKAIWFELADIAPLGVLRIRDRWLVETACLLKHEERTDAVGMSSANRALLVTCLSRMGMTPSDASKVHAPKEKQASPFSKFAAKVSAARKDPSPVH